MSTGVPWWNVWMRRNAFFVVWSYGFTGYSMLIHGGPRSGADSSDRRIGWRPAPPGAARWSAVVAAVSRDATSAPMVNRIMTSSRLMVVSAGGRPRTLPAGLTTAEPDGSLEGANRHSALAAADGRAELLPPPLATGHRLTPGQPVLDRAGHRHGVDIRSRRLAELDVDRPAVAVEGERASLRHLPVERDPSGHRLEART